MALIICPECGKEISDKASACPNCGCPVDEYNKEQEITIEEKFDKQFIDIYNEYAKCSVLWVDKKRREALNERMGMDKKTAQKMLDDYRRELRIKYYEKHPERITTQKSVNEFEHKQTENKIPHCPKCRSTAISYESKKLSLGRAAVGGILAGPAGAVLGGVTSKKGYAVCLNCGKRWKI